MSQHSKQEIFEQLKQTFHELFEINPDEITLDSRLYQDLDIDSIDAVDLIVKLQTMTGRKFNVEEFKMVRTVSDVVDILHTEFSRNTPSA